MPWTFYNSSGQKLSTAATSIDVLDIDGATDIGAAIVDADLFIVDDGAGGTNRKTAASRIKTYIGSAAISREGGQTTESTTTSTSSVDLITASSLTVLATQHGYLALCARNSSGGAVTGQLGLKLNSTVVGESDESALWRGTSANADQTGGTRAWWGQTLTNYQSSGGCLIHASTTATGATVHGGVGSIPSTNPIPIATITDVVIRAGQTGGGGRTIGADELSVYSYATS